MPVSGPHGGPIGARIPLDFKAGGPVQFVDTPDAAVVVEDAWCSQPASRAVEFYRGSYSLNVSAVDQEGPGITFAGPVASRATAYYKAPKASTMSVFFSEAAAPDVFAAPVTQGPTAPYYTTPASSVVAPLTPAALDDWAQATFGRATPYYYQGARAVTISVYDPATNTFADWTPAALLSRSVEAYSPPAAQPVTAWGDSIVTDRYAPLIVSRLVDWYAPPSAQPVTSWGESIVTDAPAPFAQSRSTDWYTPPASLLAPVYFEEPFAGGTEWVPATIARPFAFYRGSYSLNITAADQEVPADTWAAAYQSALSPRRAAPPQSVVSGVFDNPVAEGFWASIASSRRIASYAAPLARFVPVYDESQRVTWALVIQGRAVAYFAPQGSQFIYAFDGPSGVVPGEPGGGGFGAIMSPGFFERYEPRYAARYAPRYKPTIRKQKP